jgi:outer membrane murein-binding lipoprotein Lpp
MHERQHDISRGEVLRQIEGVTNYVAEHAAEIPGIVYDAFNNFSEVALSYLGDPAWDAKLVASGGWSAEQASALSELLPYASVMAGGGEGIEGELQKGIDTNIFKYKPELPPFSIDDAVEKVQSYLNWLDEENKKLAATVGAVAFVKGSPGNTYKDYQFGPYPPYFPAQVPVSPNMILVLINSALEACRLLVSNNFFDSPTLRKILSFVLSLYDILRGSWRDGVLSFLGVFGQSWMITGMILKSTRWVYSFVSPDIQTQLQADLYKASKSMIIGYFLWMVTIVSPAFVREKVDNLMIAVKTTAEQVNEQIDQLEPEVQAVAAKMGASVKFPRIPLNQIPSFDDLQNLQILLRQPLFYCNDAVKPKIESAAEIPSLRLFLELLSIPYKSEKVAEKCKDISSEPVQAITQALEPTVVQTAQTPPPVVAQPPLPPRGGKRKTRKNKTKQKSRKTRKSN